MKWNLDFEAPPVADKIFHSDKILFVGSCFTEHIGKSFHELKFPVMQNPNGIIFDPETISSSIISYIQNRQFTEADLFQTNELWHNWAFHSRYSGPDKKLVLERMNESVNRAHHFLIEAKWLVITLGTSYQYKLAESNKTVANCHRVPAAVFRKHLMTIEEINTALDAMTHMLLQFNPGIRLIFTVSPVRHMRDGLNETNRSKARLLESTHHLVNKFERLYYFPAYELVIDVLRDYRFYDTDMTHPNYQATRFVLDHFISQFTDLSAQTAIAEMNSLRLAYNHRVAHPGTEAYRRFKQQHLDQVKEYMLRYPYASFDQEHEYFSRQD